MRKLQQAAKWMWDHRGQNTWWRSQVLTPQNPDPTAPQLTLVEAESIFRLMEEKKLIFPSRHSDGTIVYLINEVKISEWSEFLKGMSPFHRFVLQPLLKIFKNIWIMIIWLISIIVATVMTTFLNQWMRSFFSGK